jgi:hypothetical protein
MKIDGRKLRKVLTRMIAELDKEPKRRKPIGNNLRDCSYGIGTIKNYHVSLELIEWDCPASEMANIAEVITD